MNKTTVLIGTALLFLFYCSISSANDTLFHQKPHLKLPDSTQSIQYLTKTIQKKQPKLTQKLAQEIARAVYKYSKPFPPKLIIALMERESSLIPTKTSRTKCIGLMQINPEAHPDKVAGFSRSELYGIDTNVKIGCQILREYYNKTGTISGALKRYLGANNIKYRMDILSSYADMTISKK